VAPGQLARAGARRAVRPCRREPALCDLAAQAARLPRPPPPDRLRAPGELLFDDTIAANIAFGDRTADLERVEWAARVANAYEFIARLPLRFETRIGESGLLLSGGQQQRIAIARAVYQRPPILVFDEATSALDTESERAVQANMDEVFEGRTSFVIAHRLSTIRDADLILVLERGRIAEQGAHDELMRRQGIYYYLVSQQLAL
jgi:ABC-type multidrug transport system fused ATPase/permease subunit